MKRIQSKFYNSFFHLQFIHSSFVSRWNMNFWWDCSFFFFFIWYTIFLYLFVFFVCSLSLSKSPSCLLHSLKSHLTTTRSATYFCSKRNQKKRKKSTNFQNSTNVWNFDKSFCAIRFGQKFFLTKCAEKAKNRVKFDWTFGRSADRVNRPK